MRVHPGNVRKSNLKCGNNLVLDEFVQRQLFLVSRTDDMFVSETIASFDPAGGRVNAHAAGYVVRS